MLTYRDICDKAWIVLSSHGSDNDLFRTSVLINEEFIVDTNDRDLDESIEHIGELAWNFRDYLEHDYTNYKYYKIVYKKSAVEELGVKSSGYIKIE